MNYVFALVNEDDDREYELVTILNGPEGLVYDIELVREYLDTLNLPHYMKKIQKVKRDPNDPIKIVQFTSEEDWVIYKGKERNFEFLYRDLRVNRDVLKWLVETKGFIEVIYKEILI